jgi:CRISPR-associated protein Cmr2
MDPGAFWLAKLAAWTHAPAEKPLVLLRDPSGHEGGTVRRLRERLFGDGGLPNAVVDIVRKADRWAAAADRPQFPLAVDEQNVGARVDFTREPVLIHLLSGREYRIDEPLREQIPVADIKAVSLNHFNELIVIDGESVDYRRTFLSFWRNGPDSPHGALGVLWRLLPADTRVPTHSIWDHLQLTSALAGAMTADPTGTPALMVVSIGPVQSFIEQSRSTSDLWAGSHLLSRIVWEALEVVCETLGPDSVIYPSLLGVPLADRWLQAQDVQVFRPAERLRALHDGNPLFVASLPNRFLAIVPATSAHPLAQEMERRTRAWVGTQARRVIARLLQEAQVQDRSGAEASMVHQAERQLADFPEFHWAAVPWSLIREEREDIAEDRSPNCRRLNTDALEKVRGALCPGSKAGPLLGTDAWKVLSEPIAAGGVRFYSPNPGVLYPELHEVASRALAAVKATRRFTAAVETGYRCSLCGEREWLTDDEGHLHLTRAARGSYTLWARVSSKHPSWSRRSEHLCSLCALKRLWPLLVQEDPLFRFDNMDSTPVQRFVVSTHTMALVPTLDRLVDMVAGDRKTPSSDAMNRLLALTDQVSPQEFVALPRKLAHRLGTLGESAKAVRRIPLLLEAAAEEEGADEEATEVARLIKKATGVGPERYYSLVLLDGDRLGAWLAGNDRRLQTQFECSWHPSVKSLARELAKGSNDLDRYLNQARPSSPARHMFISRALNGYSLHLARVVVEDIFNGKLIYAGGDDLLAMVAIDVLLDVLSVLRHVYSGLELPERLRPPVLDSANDFVWLRKERRLLATMSCRATLSAGAVIAHHSAPLGSVLRTLREAERGAKNHNNGARDAFQIVLLKRAGGRSVFTSSWFPPSGSDAASETPSGPRRLVTTELLVSLRDALSATVARRAAYQVLGWLQGVGESWRDAEGLTALLAYELGRHQRPVVGPGGESSGLPAQKTFDGALSATREDRQRKIRDLAADLVRASVTEAATSVEYIQNAVMLAEFLAREGRTGA